MVNMTLDGPATGKAVKRILVVDDSPDQAESLSLLLQLLGHEVRVTFDGPSALKVAEEFVPDIALVDIELPVMNGYEVARSFRAKPRLNKAILVAQTGWGADDDRRRSLEAGFDHHLVKPLSPDILKGLLANASPRD